MGQITFKEAREIALKQMDDYNRKMEEHIRQDFKEMECENCGYPNFVTPTKTFWQKLKELIIN